MVSGMFADSSGNGSDGDRAAYRGSCCGACARLRQSHSSWRMAPHPLSANCVDPGAIAYDGKAMSYAVDFVNVSTTGLESSPVAPALAGLRANEARYFKNKYDFVFTVEPADGAKETVDWVHRILKEEREIVIASPPLEVAAVEVENIWWPYVFYQSGLSINVMYARDNPSRRAVGFKLSDGAEVPPELGAFKFGVFRHECG